jgi:predicted porin
MKKTAILATAIAAVLAAPLATAAKHEGKGPHVTVYGKAHVSVDNYDRADNWRVDSNSSRLGFKGSEDLGNGMTAKFQYEIGYDVTDGGAFGGARNSWVGLAGGFGEVRIGRHDTPAKTVFYAAGNDRLGDSIIDLNDSFGFAELRASNVVAYINKFGDLTFLAAIAPGEGTAAAGNNGLADATSFGLAYSAGPIKASLGITDAGSLVGTGATRDLMNLGGSYAISDSINVGLQYQTVDNGVTERTAMAIGGTIGLGDGLSVILQIGNAEDDVAGATTEADVMGLALNKKFSKRTSAYVAYVDGDETPNNLTNPWIGNGGSTANGSAFSIGVVHNF